jgi:hypothetical protein
MAGGKLGEILGPTFGDERQVSAEVLLICLASIERQAALGLKVVEEAPQMDRTVMIQPGD